MCGVNVGVHELFTPSELVGGTAMSSSQHTSGMERTSESCWESEQTDCSRAGWRVDYHFGPSALQRPKVGRIRDAPGGNAGFLAKEIRTTPDLGWRLQCELVRADILSSRGRVHAETENTDGHKRYFARTNIRHCCGRTGPDGDEHMDGRRLRTGTVHTKQLDGSWGRRDANGLHHGIMETGSKTNAGVGL